MNRMIFIVYKIKIFLGGYNVLGIVLCVLYSKEKICMVNLFFYLLMEKLKDRD